MHPRIIIPQSLATLAELQAGVVSREQALGLGLSRSVLARLTAQDLWHRLERGVYFTDGRNPTWLAAAWAGLLMGGDAAQLAGHAAGHLWGISPAPDLIEVLIPEDSRTRDRGRWRFRRSHNPPRPVGSPSRTPLPDTIIDLCAAEPAQAAHWVQTAIFTNRTSASAIAKVLAGRPRHPNRELITSVLTDHQQGVHSELERVYRQKVERAHKLPTGVRQIQRAGGPADVEYLGKVIVELDGAEGHRRPGQRLRDMAKDNANLAGGRPTLRYGWFDVNELSCQVARQLAKVLKAAGWKDDLEPCPNCRRMHNAEDLAA